MSASKPVISFVVAFGEDYYLDKLVDKYRKLDRRVILMDGDSVSESQLVSVCSEQSFEEDYSKVVILDNANAVKGDKTLSSLTSYLEGRGTEDASTILLAIIRADKLTTVWTKISVFGSVQEFKKLRSYELPKMIERVGKEASALKLTLEEGVGELLVKLIGMDLRRISNELKKFAHLVGVNGVVQKSHVLSVVPHALPAEAYQVAEATLAKNPRRAMDLLAVVYKHTGEGAGVPITVALMRQLERTLILRQMLDANEDSKVISARLEVHEFVLKKNMIPIAQKHTVRSLLGHMKNLCTLETQVKGAARSKRTLVELAVLSIAG